MRRCPGEIIVCKKFPTPKYKLNIILTKRSLSLIIAQRHTHDLWATLNVRRHSWLCSKGLVPGPGVCGKAVASAQRTGEGLVFTPQPLQTPGSEKLTCAPDPKMPKSLNCMFCVLLALLLQGAHRHFRENSL